MKSSGVVFMGAIMKFVRKIVPVLGTFIFKAEHRLRQNGNDL